MTITRNVLSIEILQIRVENFMKKEKILIIDDEQAVCEACSAILKAENLDVFTAQDGPSGLQRFEETKPDVVFIDLKMPGMSGMNVLSRLNEKDPDAVLIVITGYSTIESAVESMKRGAFDYLPKPFTPDELRIITKRALEKRAAVIEARRVKEEKEQMRQNFISLVSHELRTPLAAVMQYIEVLSVSLAGKLSPEQFKIIERMKVRMNELLSLIDRWLKLARIEELKLKDSFKYFALDQVIKEAMELTDPLAREKKIKVELIHTDNDAQINGDRDMIKEIFVNLITNGIKYNREGGSVQVSLRGDENFWIIDVIDTGIGIKDKDLPMIGQEFYRVRQEGLVSGSGLGLAIVRKILSIHDGKLEIKSQVGQGSTFSVYLPRLSKQ